MLKPEQINQYNDDGFLVINNVFNQQEIQEMIDAFQCHPIQDHFAKNPNSFGFHLLEITTMHPTFLKYACHPKIINLIKPLIGNDIQLQHSKLTVKMPGKTKGSIPWHQDFAYLPHTNTSLLAVMICLVDFSVENGCMQMIKGAHKLGLLNHRDENGYEKNCSDHWVWQDSSKIVNIMPRKGGISIHHCLMPHSSGDNNSDTQRQSLVFEYRARDAYQLCDKVWEDTGLPVAGIVDGPLNIRLEQINIPALKTKRYLDHPFGTAFNQIGNSVKTGAIRDPYLK